MSDPIEYLDDRDDVKKTKYSAHRPDEGRVRIEMWHDAEGMKRVFDKALAGLVSEKALRKFAEEQALAVRRTTIDPSVQWRDLESLYPETISYLKEDHELPEGGYEYKRPDSK